MMPKLLSDLCAKYKNHIDNTALAAATVLGTFGFGFLGLHAYMVYLATGSFVLLGMVAVGLVILFISLIPAYRMYKIIEKMEKQNENRN